MSFWTKASVAPTTVVNAPTKASRLMLEELIEKPSKNTG